MWWLRSRMRVRCCSVRAFASVSRAARAASPSSPAHHVSCLVIGGGVIGLAVTARLARAHYGLPAPSSSVVVLERHALIGSETSSRNSEVVHAGLYYAPDMLKTALCIRGRTLLRAVCEQFGIPARVCGKYIVAQDDAEAAYLEQLRARAVSLGVPVRMLARAQWESGEPELQAHAVLESSDTGIVDSHALMQFLHADLEAHDGALVLQHGVDSVRFDEATRTYLVQSGDECIAADALVNCAGLSADRVARMVMGERTPAAYRLYYCKGVYYAYEGRSPVQRLIYPVPPKTLAGLGVHATIDLGGRMKIGPDAEYVDDPADMSVSSARLPSMVEAVRRYLPRIDAARFAPDYAGMRPKLAPPGAPNVDFSISEESARGFPRLVNLLGIESPGLTSSLAIADYVAQLLGVGERGAGWA